MSKRNFGSLSRGQKGQNPPHSLDLEKKSKFSKKMFCFFCELSHSEQENKKIKIWKHFLPSDLQHSSHLEKKIKI